MRGLAYVVFYRARYSGQEFYWTGAYLPSGAPQVSTQAALAGRFPSAREAYESAARCQRMARWHVGRRGPFRALEVAA